MKRSLSDAPLEKPEDDLLGIARFPQKLSELIRENNGPLTVGVYGQWGSGKTSFIQLVRYHLTQLEKPFDFISFSAWPYRTADELWRAMILDVARIIYRIPDEPNAESKEDSSSQEETSDGLLNKLGSFLMRDALLIYDTAPVQTPQRQYQKLVTRLDSTTYGTISKDSSQRLTVDYEEAAMAVVKAALSSLGPLTPLLAGVRGLFGAGADADLSSIVRREKNEAIRERIASVEQFKNTFKELFQQPLEQRRLCVFVDDLDRCMPDVALDLLEAIKIILVDFPWVFLVAADRETINQGLRMRYRGYADDSTSKNNMMDLARKGDEYFEKIIQLHIPVPTPDVEKLLSFISVQFPHLRPVSDIILLAAGENPRRIKQYCQWLRYKQGACEEPEQSESASEWIAAFENVLALNAINSKCTEQLRSLAGRAEVSDHQFDAAISDLEADCRSNPVPVDEHCKSNALPECLSILKEARESPRLLEQLSTEAVRRSLTRRSLAALLDLADLRPDPIDGLFTSDAPFMRILRYLDNCVTVNMNALMAENIATLSALARYFPDASAAIYKLAASHEWTMQMKAVEDEINPQRTGLGSPPGEIAKQLLQMIDENQIIPVSESETPSITLRALLSRHPPFSALTRDEVLGFEQIYQRWESLRQALPASTFGELSDREQRLWEVNQLLQHPSLQCDLAGMREGLRIRIAIARHFRELRVIAKLDAWERKREEYQLKIDQRSLFAVEDQLNATSTAKPTQDQTRNEKRLWQLCDRDESLRSLLLLRPRFRDINPREYARYQRLSVQASASSSAKPLAESKSTSKAKSKKSAGPAAASTAYVPLELTIGPGDAANKYVVSLQNTSSPSEPEVSSTISLDMNAVLDEVNLLSQAQRNAPLMRSEQRTQAELNKTLRQIGKKLFEWFIQKEVRESIGNYLELGNNYRIFLRVDVPALVNIPWESLYLPSLNSAISLTRRTSLVRYFSGPSGAPPPQLTPPLNILVIMPRPEGVAPIHGEQEHEILRATLSPAMERKIVRLTILEAESANLDELRSVLRREEPNIVQFVGHGMYDESLQKGRLIFQSGRSPLPVDADHFSTMLLDSSVSVVVLNGCDTGRSSSNDALSSVAASVVSAGVPAAIATMREVYDEAALRFTREFYRAFVDGYTLESSMIEARKALYAENWNWSAYALFTSVKPNLDFLKLHVPTGRSQAMADDLKTR